MVAVMAFFILFFPLGYGQGQDSEDPAGYCSMHIYPYIEMCNQQKINQVLQDVINTSKRFECNGNDDLCALLEKFCKIEPQICAGEPREK